MKETIKEATKESNLIDKDELNIIAMTAENISYLMSEMLDEYFGQYDPNNNDDELAIMCEFSRNRSKAEIVCDGINAIVNKFSSLDIGR